MSPQPIIFVVGPTATGKTEVAFLLAQELKGEIISCDAMQVYREISIANNKPPLAMREKIVHHLIDFVSVKEEFDVARYNQMALKTIREIINRKRMPIIVGGSGLYMQILLDGIFQEKGKDLTLRKFLKERLLKEGSEALYAELKKVDKDASLKIHPHDTRRMLRALEVFYLTQRPISELKKNRSGVWGKYNITILGLNCDRKLLYQRINQRVEEMILNGLIEEIKNLKDIQLSLTSDKIIGVSEIKGYLEGKYDIIKAKDLMKLKTRHFAKRQLTWFRKDKRLKWVEFKESDSPSTIVKKIISILRKS